MASRTGWEINLLCQQTIPSKQKMLLNKFGHKKLRIYLYILFTIVSGQCVVNAVDLIDHVYQIASANDLKEFADLVNNGDSCANAILTSDVDYRGNSVTIGLEDCPYCGEFDGACHRITVVGTYYVFK